MSEVLLPRSVAIIGSFRRKYKDVLQDWQTFKDAGLSITSPKGTPIIEPGGDFVRFESDDPYLSDEEIEQVALHRILRADFVYAELPDGYVGRTACLEIGRILGQNRPLYFSEYPNDLPIEVPETHMVRAAELVERFRSEMPRPLLESLTGVSYGLEQNLIAGNYLNM